MLWRRLRLFKKVRVGNPAKIISIFKPVSGTVLYIYVWKEDNVYPTVVSTYNQKIWLVMFSLSGILETAFPPTDPEGYLADERFYYAGLLQEFLK